MNTPNNMSFHEATVVRFCRNDSVLDLELEDVLVDGRKSRVFLCVSPVVSVEVDGVPSSGPLMESDDGEVLTLELTEDNLSLIVEWNDFSLGSSVTRSYRVTGSGLALDINYL